jgi:hypothetical protein
MGTVCMGTGAVLDLLTLGIPMRRPITRKPWTSKGLVNGAQKIVKKIWFNQGFNSQSHLPDIVFVKFDRPETPGWEGMEPT